MKQDATPGSLFALVLAEEKRLVREALAAEGGSVTRAARRLKIKHQALCYIINQRHKDLLEARRPIKKRQKSIIKTRSPHGVLHRRRSGPPENG